MKVIVLASGSNGNSTYVKTADLSLLIDCGISAKQIQNRLLEMNVDYMTIDKIFLTHEHIDHVRGLAVLSAKNPKFQIYLTKGTYEGLSYDCRMRLEAYQVNFIKQDEVLNFGNTKITILRTHHDAREPIGLMIEEGEKRFVYITDTGYFEESYFAKISNPDLLLIESNYDVDLLYTSERPFELKKRIDSNYGHLSNYDSALLVSRIVGPKTKRVILGHISEDCNFYFSPKTILKFHQDIYEEIGLDTAKISFDIGNRNGITGEYDI